MSDDEVPQCARGAGGRADARLLSVDGDEAPALVDGGAPPAGTGTGDRFERAKIPMTLLTGYLGAGKSTLLDYVMTADHGYRIAVCMNDFGDSTDIEAKALNFSSGGGGGGGDGAGAGGDGGDGPTTAMLSLPNGCLCCSFKDMGIAAIEEMVAAQKDKVDWVMIELTGLADPAPIARDFWTNEEMGDLLLDSVVCVVDSRNILNQLGEERADRAPTEAERQVACADVILLNKTDLVSPAELDAVAAAVSAINPTLRVHRTAHSRMPLAGLFNLGAFTTPAAVALPPAGWAAPGCGGGEAHAHDHGAAPSPAHAHASGIATVTVPLPPLSAAQWARLNTFLEVLLWKVGAPTAAGFPVWPAGAQPEVLRTKGYALLADGSARVVQGVADLFDARTVAPAAGGGDPAPKMVFIGRHVDQRLADGLREFVGI